MKLTIRDLRLAVQLKLYASAKWILKKKLKSLQHYCFEIQKNTEAGKISKCI